MTLVALKKLFLVEGSLAQRNAVGCIISLRLLLNCALL